MVENTISNLLLSILILSISSISQIYIWKNNNFLYFKKIYLMLLVLWCKIEKYLPYAVKGEILIWQQKLCYLSKTKFQTVSKKLKENSLKNNKHFIIIFNHILLILSSNLTASIFLNIYFVCHFPLFSSQALSSTDDVIIFWGMINDKLYINAKF